MYSGDGGGLAGLNHWNCHILSRSSGRSLGLHRSLTLSRRRILAPHSRPTNNNIIIPERVRIPAIRLPPKVNPGDLRNNITPLPLPRVLVSVARSAGEALDDLVIQPGLDGAVRAEVVLEAFQVPAGSGADASMPWGERSGRVASSDSRLNMRMELWPPMRRCLPSPWAESGMVMKVTWASVRLVEAWLDEGGMLTLSFRL